MGALLLLAAYDLDVLTDLPRDVSLASALLDDEGDPWANATVYVADDGVAATSAGTVPASHRCNLIAIFALGSTGPSLRRWHLAGSEDTLRFARTESGDTTKRTMTRVAEYLHDVLPGVL